MNVLTAAKRGAQMVPGTMTRPDAEWIPVLIYEDRNGIFGTAALMPGALEDVNLPTMVAQISTILELAGARSAALVVPVWVAPEKEGEPRRPRDRADREERVLVAYVGADSTRVEAAKVLRDETQPPRLGPWDRCADGLEASGWMLDVLRKAIG